MTFRSSLYLTALLLPLAFSVGTLSFYTTRALLPKNPKQERVTNHGKNLENHYFDVDKEMFELMKKRQDELYVNPNWYFHYTKQQTETLKV